MERMKRRKGLTLIELLIVIIILGALAAIAIPRMTLSTDNAKLRACQANIATMNTQVELFYAENDSWPTLQNLWDDPNYFPDGDVCCPGGGSYTLNADHRVECDATGH